MTEAPAGNPVAPTLAVVPAGAPVFAEVLGEARRHGVQLSPAVSADLLLVDLEHAVEDDWMSLQGLHPRQWVGIGGGEPVEVRLRALRAGMTAYFVAPLPVYDVLELIELVVARSEAECPLEVLVIDDDMLLGEYHAAVLRSAGMSVRTLVEPADVWAVLESRVPDVILVDLHMPVLSGDELAGLLERDRRYSHIPLVFLSGEGDVHRQQEALNLGGADFLIKPVRHQQLIAVVARHARRNRTLADMRGAWNAARHEAEMQRRALDAHAIVSGADIQGRITFANEKFCEISGYAAEELLGHNHRQLKSGLHPAAFYDEMWRTIASGHIWAGDVCNRRKDGSFYWVKSTIIPFNDAHGLPQRYLSIRTDITEVKRINAELEAARSMAERASQAKTEFLAQMSHELRTPMNSILGFAQLLVADPANPLSECSADNVNQILRAGWHLLELINEVLDLARIESGRLAVGHERVDLPSVLAECQHIIAPIAESHAVSLELHMLPEGRACCIRGDRLRLRQVLINLMSNGVKYNRNGGRVSVGLTVTGSEIAVAVADTGLGMTDAQQRRVFEPFSRFHDTLGVEGTGIGLTITRSLVEAMGGRITVESQPAVGSTFTVYLPLLASCHDESPPPVAATMEDTARLSVLYVEHDLANLELVKRLLSDLPGVELTTARSGPEGVEKALTVLPDLIMLDIDLPGFDGFAVKEMLAEYNDTLHIPVVAISARAETADIERAQRLGIAQYLTRPIDAARMRHLIKGYRDGKGGT